MGNLNTSWLSKCYLFRANEFMCKPRAVKHVYNVLGPGSGSGSASPSGSFSGSFSAACSCVQVRVEANLKLGVTKPPLGSLMLSFSACCTIPSFRVSVNGQSLCECSLNAIKEIFG